MDRTNRTSVVGRYAIPIPPAMPRKYASGDRGDAWYSSLILCSIRMYAASLMTCCPIRKREYTKEPKSANARYFGARTQTNTIRIASTSALDTIARGSWSWTRIDVPRKTPVPDHRLANAMGSVLVDRSPDHPQERLPEPPRTG